MPRTLSYADAARLLGGARSPVVTALDKLTGGALLGAAVAVPAVLALFDAKAEFVRLSHELVGGLAERRSGLSRYGRTERLAAAHRILVVTAFFEALAEADLPFRFEDLELTEREQVAVAGAHGADHGSLLSAFFGEDVPAPGPEQSYQSFQAVLGGYYRGVVERLRRFVVGLAAWDWLDVGQHRRFDAVLAAVPVDSVGRHQELLGRLAGEFAEVAFWAGLREHAATRYEVGRLAAALADVERLLQGISTGRPPDERRKALARACTAELGRPIVESGDVPAGIRVPTLGGAYVTPRCRVAALGPAARPSDESWWLDQPVRDDLSGFLVGHLTTPGAVEAPLLVLGQPGSGKSVLTRVLAARLPAADFLPVRVELRAVPAAADLQDQIEYAIRAATGERLEWPSLARSAGDALPVVLLDGFDELLQATGVSQTDYLAKVAAFQRREAEQGRPVVVVVTSRTSVADRSRPPEGTVALRLEPFDEPRVARWLATWNAVNAAEFAARGVVPLELPTVLAHRELAEQPLLLLMLALYDADDNGLRSAGELRSEELYERLLRQFARREVVKHRPGLPERELDLAVEDELRRLSVVAFAMFNRTAQWVNEAELEADLTALFGPAPATGTGTELRAPLRRAELVLGRFFFVHRSRALRDDERLETYEFLHATFGEFLVARFTWQVLLDVAAREAAATMPLGGGPVDDDLLQAVLSYAALSGRAPILGFLRGLMSTVHRERREVLVDLLVRLYRAAHHTRPARRFDLYQPRGLPVPARHAAYSVNLLLLAVCAAGTLHGSRLYPDRNVVPVWHRETLLWQSQLGSDDWAGLVEVLALERIRAEDGSRDIVLRVVADPAEAPVPPIDLLWTYDLRPEEFTGRSPWFRAPDQQLPRLARGANLRCAIDDDVLVHALEPTTAVLPDGTSEFYAPLSTAPTSTLHGLLAFLAMWPTPGPDESRRGYLRFAGMLRDGVTSLQPRRWLAGLVLERLAADGDLPAELAAEVVGAVHSICFRSSHGLAERLVRCCLTHFGRQRTVDERLGWYMATSLDAVAPSEPRFAAETLVRLAEAGVQVAGAAPLPEPANLLRSYPELAARYQRAVDVSGERLARPGEPDAT
ncbi:NACHT domain-containing protein [Plantactinospora endophytica]|uniref:NACHT N-terminal Helical domain-containing protein n=1 Tax=Plantactinospora endophytica TaxID=673535 RepID=A0ABQ4E675_9ACTN|nr:hypothetical protein [Plantactinospora endophytica]GIG90207.1 hypothetical protein Pen02_51430 [Plantactinospora endophytica]